jgi:hypothetical protein
LKPARPHHWARELAALGHQVRLVPPSYVKAYVKRGKNDAADAEAICEAVTRPNMRFVPVKSKEQQGVLVLHRARDLLVRQRTMLVNGLRGHMAEFGIIAPQGIQRLPISWRSWRTKRRAFRKLPARRSRPSLCRSRTLRRVSGSWTNALWLGAGPMTRRADSQPSQASVRSPPRRWRPPSPTRRYSDPAVTLRRGSA